MRNLFIICTLLATSAAAETLQAQEDTFPITILAYEWATTHQTMTFSWPGYADTSCSGSSYMTGYVTGRNISGSGTSNATCSTTFTPPTNRNIDAQYPVVYLLADTATSRMVLTCTQYARWSQCRAIEPGQFVARWKKGNLEVQAVDPKKNKEVWVKFDIEQQTAIKTQEPSKPTVQTAAPSTVQTAAPSTIQTAAPTIEAPLPGSEFPQRWKSMQSGAIHVLRFEGEYIYAEQILSEADAKTGLYYLYEFKKAGDKYVGTFKGRVIAGSNSCPVTFAAELTRVTKERIEGRMFLPQLTSKIDWNTCQFSTSPSWDEFSWIPVK